MSKETVRLNKYLAMCGLCSRRDADKLIEQGRVTVNGQNATSGMQVCVEDEILVNGKPLKGQEKKVVLAYYKPIGVTCTEKDAHAEKIITRLIDYPIRVTYAGRLDKDSEGLMLLTNDGDLIQAMMRGANCHEKEYIVKTNKEITDVFIQQMKSGVYLRELDRTTRECEVSQTGKYTFRIVLTQGLNRQIRRMCKELGYEVRSLKRIRIMNITLEQLQTGVYREVKGTELEALYSGCGLKCPGSVY
ncbi:MAG: pseudouridine synthase [Lachnospiraceae bacterium]|nr:pseudouridine synthase [Lachnospiraceae bacterium]